MASVPASSSFFLQLLCGNSVQLPVEVVFVGVAALGSILAYEGERTSRARFRSKVKAGTSQHDKTSWHLQSFAHISDSTIYNLYMYIYI